MVLRLPQRQRFETDLLADVQTGWQRQRHQRANGLRQRRSDHGLGLDAGRGHARQLVLQPVDRPVGRAIDTASTAV